jgi:hypothetical protein
MRRSNPGRDRRPYRGENSGPGKDRCGEWRCSSHLVDGCSWRRAKYRHEHGCLRPRVLNCDEPGVGGKGTSVTGDPIDAVSGRAMQSLKLRLADSQSIELFARNCSCRLIGRLPIALADMTASAGGAHDRHAAGRLAGDMGDDLSST